MKWFKTLQSRIFLSMLLLIAIVSIAIIVMTVIQYRKQAEDYHFGRLNRKERSVVRDIQYHLDNANDFLIPERLPYIFKDKIYELSHVHNLEIGIYDLYGNQLNSSRPTLQFGTECKTLPNDVLIDLKKNINHRIVKDTLFNHEDYLSTYSYIYDNTFTPIGILNIPYLGKTNFYQKELNQMLVKISFVFILALIIAIILAYLLSQIISRPLHEIATNMKSMRLYKQNQKLSTSASGTQEFQDLIDAYNGMIDELEKNAIKLAQGERERAWREMAKQVAHEIKNPLTPMRLNIQNFERCFDPNDFNIDEKIKDLSQSLIQQIDTMSTIASTFSDFAKMPTAKKELIDIVTVVHNAVDFFKEDHICFETKHQTIKAMFDKHQLVRIINNLVNNANQATEDVANPMIKVNLTEQQNTVKITVEDNGKGIDEKNKTKVFEPKFTTKTSGMGLGLAMVKSILESYNGRISFTSKLNYGTTFIVTFPKE